MTGRMQNIKNFTLTLFLSATLAAGWTGVLVTLMITHDVLLLVSIPAFLLLFPLSVIEGARILGIEDETGD